MFVCINNILSLKLFILNYIWELEIKIFTNRKLYPYGINQIFVTNLFPVGRTFNT